MKPFIKYPGGKINEFPLVEKYKPKNIARYFEPFVGGASIYLNINIEESFINDKSRDLAEFYNFIKKQDMSFFRYIKELDRLWKEIENSEEIISTLFDFNSFSQYNSQSLKTKRKKLKSLESDGYNISQTDRNDMVMTAKKTALYMCVRELYNKKNVDRAKHTACFYFIREYCYSSMFRFSQKGYFNVPYGGRSYNYKYMTSKIQQMQSPEVIKLFERTGIYNLDFEAFLNLFDLNANDFIFLDPPYDTEFSTYDNNVFNKCEQVRLAELLSRMDAKWMLIIKKTDFIYKLYKRFHIFEYDKNYLVSFKNRNVKDAKHLLITNYDIEE